MDNFFERILRSSANPEKVGMMVKGFIIGFFPLIITVAALLGVDLPEGDLVGFAESLGAFITGALGLVSLGMIVVGFARKIIIRVQRRFQ